MKILPQPFKWNDLSIWQSDEVFKIGTDGILLSAWIQHLPEQEDVNSILDAGTGTGVVAMALQKKFPDAKVDAIDINEKAVSLAAINFSHYPADSNLTARLENIFDEPTSRVGKYDIITCNPPYYFNQLRNRNDQYDTAKHSDETVCEWINALNNRLRMHGRLFIIIPYVSAFDWIKCANQEGMYCVNRLDVYAKEHDASPARTLLQFGTVLQKMHNDTLTMYDSDNKLTAGFIKFSGIHTHHMSMEDVS